MAFTLEADDAFLSESRASNLSESHAREMRTTFSHSLDRWRPVASLPKVSLPCPKLPPSAGSREKS